MKSIRKAGKQRDMDLLDELESHQAELQAEDARKPVEDQGTNAESNV